MSKVAYSSLVAIAALAAAPVGAREIDRVEVSQTVDTSAQISANSTCNDTDKVTAGQVEKLELCTRWRHEIGFTIIRRYLVADAPEKLAKDQRRLVAACLRRAVARAQANARGAEPSLSDAQLGFDRCSVSSVIADPQRITLRFEEQSEQRKVR